MKILMKNKQNRKQNKISTFLGEVIRSAYLVNAVLKVQGGKGGGKELPLIGVPSSLSV